MAESPTVEGVARPECVVLRIEPSRLSADVEKPEGDKTCCACAAPAAPSPFTDPASAPDIVEYDSTECVSERTSWSLSTSTLAERLGAAWWWMAGGESR